MIHGRTFHKASTLIKSAHSTQCYPFRNLDYASFRDCGFEFKISPTQYIIKGKHVFL